MQLQELVSRADEARDDDHWIGPRPSAVQIAAFLAIGSIALLIAGVQPLLLEALVSEDRLTAASLGWTITIEFLALGVGVGAAGACLKPTHLPARALAATAVIVAADLFVTLQSGILPIMASRIVAGVAEGVLVWQATLMITRSATPAMWGGVFLVTQGLLQVAFAAVLPPTLMRTMGANGGWYGLAGVTLLAAPLALLLPRSMVPLSGPRDDAQGSTDRLPAAAIASLASVFLIYAFFIGFFAYLPQIGGEAGLAPQHIGFAVSVGLGTSILGSGVAALLARRVSYYAATLASFGVFMAVLAGLATLHDGQAFMVATAVFGFFWGFLMPYQTPFVIESDPSRRAALLQPGVQAVGAASGPLLCSFVVTDHGATGVLGASVACLLGAFAIATALHVRHLINAGRTSKGLDFNP